MRFLARAAVGTVLIASAIGIGVAPAASADTPDAAATCTKVETQRLSAGSDYYLFIPVSSSGSRSCVMGVGNSGPAVTALQQALKYCYGSGIQVDGIFGPATRSALIAAQRREHIPADGVYGPVTAAHLKFAAGNRISGRIICGGRP